MAVAQGGGSGSGVGRHEEGREGGTGGGGEDEEVEEWCGRGRGGKGMRGEEGRERGRTVPYFVVGKYKLHLLLLLYYVKYRDLVKLSLT